MASEKRTIETPERAVEISSPDKVYFPELGATKFDLATYYVEMAAALEVTATDRPAMLQRFPEGAGGKLLLPEAGAAERAELVADDRWSRRRMGRGRTHSWWPTSRMSCGR